MREMQRIRDRKKTARQKTRMIVGMKKGDRMKRERERV